MNISGARMGIVTDDEISKSMAQARKQEVLSDGDKIPAKTKASLLMNHTPHVGRTAEMQDRGATIDALASGRGGQEDPREFNTISTNAAGYQTQNTGAASGITPTRMPNMAMVTPTSGMPDMSKLGNMSQVEQM
jgi:hypothetical protein